MNRTEFIERLQRALAAGISSGQVADNVRYYQDYIDSEVRRGRSEREVLDSLGDPRLLAKSIIEANKHAGTSYGSNRQYDEEVTEDRQEWKAEGDMPTGRSYVLPGWLVMLIVTVVVLLVIGVVFSLLSFFAPVIIVVLVALLIAKVIQNNWRGR